jgi:hypothetical protein
MISTKDFKAWLTESASGKYSVISGSIITTSLEVRNLYRETTCSQERY